jgi:hypothetical protein
MIRASPKEPKIRFSFESEIDFPIGPLVGNEIGDANEF